MPELIRALHPLRQPRRIPVMGVSKNGDAHRSQPTHQNPRCDPKSRHVGFKLTKALNQSLNFRTPTQT
jgi:hypothetical protein